MPLSPSTEMAALLKTHKEKLAAIDAEVKKLELAEAEAKKSPDGADKKRPAGRRRQGPGRGQEEKRADVQAATPVRCGPLSLPRSHGSRHQERRASDGLAKCGSNDKNNAPFWSEGGSNENAEPTRIAVV